MRKQIIAVLLSLSVLSSVIPYAQSDAASKKISLSAKKVTIMKGKQKTIKIKNVNKKDKIKWSISDSRKVKMTVKKKSVVLKALKTGTAKLTAKVKKKKYTCKITIVKASSTGTSTAAPTETPTGTSTAAPTEAPTGTSTAAPTEAPTGTFTAAPIETPTGTATTAPIETPTGTATTAPTGTTTTAPTETPTGTATTAPTGTSTATPTKTSTEAPTGTATTAPTEAPTITPGSGEQDPADFDSYLTGFGVTDLGEYKVYTFSGKKADSTKEEETFYMYIHGNEEIPESISSLEERNSTLADVAGTGFSSNEMKAYACTGITELTAQDLHSCDYADKELSYTIKGVTDYTYNFPVMEDDDSNYYCYNSFSDSRISENDLAGVRHAVSCEQFTELDGVAEDIMNQMAETAQDNSLFLVTEDYKAYPAIYFSNDKIVENGYYDVKDIFSCQLGSKSGIIHVLAERNGVPWIYHYPSGIKNKKIVYRGGQGGTSLNLSVAKSLNYLTLFPVQGLMLDSKAHIFYSCKGITYFDSRYVNGNMYETENVQECGGNYTVTGYDKSTGRLELTCYDGEKIQITSSDLSYDSNNDKIEFSSWCLEAKHKVTRDQLSELYAIPFTFKGENFISISGKCFRDSNDEVQCYGEVMRISGVYSDGVQITDYEIYPNSYLISI